MPKSKKPKKTPNLQPEFVLDPNLEKPKKPRKKNAPDRPQPAWMFPPVEENPVLNPTPKSEERKLKDKDDHDEAIKFLKYKSVTTPVKPAPPALLLTLVGAFLSSYGFNSTSRIYNTELASRKKLDEWSVVIDEKLPKGYPDLVRIFKDGHILYEKIAEGYGLGDKDLEDDGKNHSKKKSKKGEEEEVESKAPANEEDTSSSGSSDSGSDDGSSEEGGSEVEIGDATSTKVLSKDAKSRKRARSSSSSSSSSDSEADLSHVENLRNNKRKRSTSPSSNTNEEDSSHKSTKKGNTPFQRVPRDTQVDGKFSSNKYQSYDYADQAHQDLSVTRGKGFTKEKNKKKRGSYRGGAIDIEGGRGVKFED